MENSRGRENASDGDKVGGVRKFLGEPKNEDHVPCFSIWGEGMARNFSKSQSLYIGGISTTMSLRVVCSRLVFGKVTFPNTRTSEARCKLTGRV